MSRREIPPCSKTYGFPVYCASWVPLEKISAEAAASSAAGEGGEEKEAVDRPEVSDEARETPVEGDISPGGSSSSGEAPPDDLFLVLGGGGGEGRSGVPNAILIASYDLASRSLSEQPVHRMGTGQDLPYRTAVHPEGEGILFAFPNGCRFFEWETSEDTKPHRPQIKSSARTLPQLEDIGLQLALAFNPDGSLLATGGEDGHMRVFKWPSLELFFEQIEAEKSVKDLNFGFDGKFLASVSDTGICRVWELDSHSIVANLTRENREKFLLCRFSQPIEGDPVLYTLSAQAQYVRIVSWSTVSWKKVTLKDVSRDPVSAFNVSPNGKFLAIGTIEGDVTILNSKLQAQFTVKRAHLGLVTTLVFSQDSRALASASFDSFSRVTAVDQQEKGRIGGLSLWVIFLVILLAVLAYYVKERGLPHRL